MVEAKVRERREAFLEETCQSSKNQKTNNSTRLCRVFYCLTLVAVHYKDDPAACQFMDHEFRGRSRSEVHGEKN